MQVRESYRAIVIFSTALFAFVWIALSVEMGSAMAAVDVSVSEWLHAHAWAPVTKVMTAISFLGAPSTLTAVTVIICVVQARKRSYDRLIVALTLVLGGNLLNYGLKILLHRGRPVFEDPLLFLSSYSFPSGHAVASTVFYGFVIGGVLLVRQQWRGAAIAGGTLMIALVGLSRAYLGAHYLSDVLAGMLEAIAWSTLVIAVWRAACSSPQTVGPHR
jgi:membrane-associated phospholipid phosphatase